MPVSKDSFLAQLRRFDALSQISSLLSWDEQVNLPPNAASSKQRATQCAELSELVHREFTHPDFEEKLQQIEGQEVDEDWSVILREVRRDLDRATRLPSEFVARKAEHASVSYHVWKDARSRNDFASYAPALEKTLNLSRQEAAFIGFEDNPYDYHLDKHDPGMDVASISMLFDELQTGLIPLAERILELAEKVTMPELVGYPEDKQEIFLREVAQSLGFDFSRGRIDVAVHPFCSGNAADTRLTTRYNVNNPLDSLFGAIHETGHGLYEQGLPSKWWGTPLGEAAGMAVHESQSRIWENQVGRSQAFWNHWEPRFRELFPESLSGVSSKQLYLVVNKVARNPIRVEADEVTYNLHVILRFELEQALFNGDLKITELPDAWNAKAEKLLGLTPDNDTEGVLQDVHWSSGAFGYFPSYCLGNLLAAQLWDAAQQDQSSINEDMEAGQYKALLTWLGDKVHRHGRRLNLLQLAELATSQKLSSQALLKYLESRYLPLYETT